MVKVRVRINENLEWNDVPFGVTSNDFNKRFGHEVVTATARKFEIDYGDGPTGTYTGRNLEYREVTVGGKTLEVPFKGVITGYTEGPNFNVQVSVKAREVFKTARTKSDADNIKLFNKLLNGRDDFRLGNGDDTGNMRGGNDQVRAGGGDDVIGGGAGKDRLWGQKGDDILEGDGGADRLWGGAGRDQLEGGKGNDELTGGGGGDEFQFTGRKQGRDVIKDFGAGDKVVIDSTRVDAFEDLQLATVQGSGAVRYDGTTIVFEGLARGDFDGGRFEFV